MVVMRITVCGTACVGKSTFIKDFLAKWPMYKTPEKSYRDLAREGKIVLNKQGSKESQRAILDFFCDQIIQYKRTDNIIYDRGLIDNFAYSLWLNAKKPEEVDDLFMEQCIQIMKNSLQFYDIIFFIPLSEKYPIEIVPDENREIDPVFREEIDNILKATFNDYWNRKKNIFPKENCPAVIELFGSREERLKMAELYINNDGSCYGEEDSLVKDLLS